MSDATTIINQLLSQSDIETVTERTLRSQVKEKLGHELSTEEVQCVKDAIEKFLDTKDPPEGTSGDVGQKRKQASPEASEPAPKSVRKDEAGHKVASASSRGEDTNISLSDLKRVQVRTFKSMILVDLRECYRDKSSGELKPGKKGLSLLPDQWQQMAESLPKLAAAFEAKDTSYSLELSSNRRATVSEFKGKFRVDVREYYQAKDGDWKPGQKGLGLNGDELQALRQHTQDISNAVDALKS